MSDSEPFPATYTPTVSYGGTIPDVFVGNTDLTLILALLKRDHIIFASDRRHTRGDVWGNYKDDFDVKILPVRSGSCVMGFAGHDLSEQIAIPAKNHGLFEGQTLESIVTGFSDFAENVYRKHVPDITERLQNGTAPSVEFLFAGFDQTSEGLEATAYRLCSPEFVPLIAQYPCKEFEVIGRSQHGALYGLHRFHGIASDMKSGLRLATFVLTEICECDTTVGGKPELMVLHRDGKVTRLTSSESEALARWAADCARKIEHEFLPDK